MRDRNKISAVPNLLAQHLGELEGFDGKDWEKSRERLEEQLGNLRENLGKFLGIFMNLIEIIWIRNYLRI